MTPRRVHLILVFGAIAICEQVHAYCVYNRSGQTMQVRVVHNGRTLREHSISAGGRACAHYANHLGLPRGELVTIWIETPNPVFGQDWLSILNMQAGGYAVVYHRSRAELSPNNSSYPDDLFAVTYDFTDAVRDDSRPSGFNGATLQPADRSVRFLVSADPQYVDTRFLFGDEFQHAESQNNSSDRVMKTMVDIVRNRQARGIILAGDLTQGSHDVESMHYSDHTFGLRRFFFEGFGNHDINCSGILCTDAIDDLNLDTIKRNTVLTDRSRGEMQGVGPWHYSWDWEDVHFVQLNLFPGDTPQRGHDPRGSLTFLKNDLWNHVGTTGRPVILIHHYGFDGFSVGNNTNNPPWWTQDQRSDYLDVLRPYNVVAMFTGHSHLSVADGVAAWSLTVNDCGTNGHCANFVAGAARGGETNTGFYRGVFLDVEINACNEMIVTRKNRFGEPIRDQQVVVRFTAPGQIDSACNTGTGGCWAGPKNAPATPLTGDFVVAALAFGGMMRLRRPVTRKSPTQDR